MAGLTDAQFAALLRREVLDFASRTRSADGSRPFHYVMLMMLARQPSLLPPGAMPAFGSEEEALAYTRAVFDNRRHESPAETGQTLLALLRQLARREIAPLYNGDGNEDELRVIMCNDNEQRRSESTFVSCCPQIDRDVACDDAAGSGYYAKTNGRTTVFAGLLHSERARRAPLEFGGMRLPSLTVFTLLHEFGHILYAQPAARHLFEPLHSLYNRAARLLSRDTLERSGIILNDVDFRELQASYFAASLLSKLPTDWRNKIGV